MIVVIRLFVVELIVDSIDFFAECKGWNLDWVQVSPLTYTTELVIFDSRKKIGPKKIEWSKLID